VNPNDYQHLSNSAFTRLVDAHSKQLTYYAWNRTQNIDTAREIVQEVFLRLAKTDIRKIGDHLVPWLYTVCRNLTIDYQRKQSRWVMNREQEIDSRNKSAEPDPGKASVRSETRALLRQCIEDLPERDREVMLLKFQNGFSYKDIARITELSVSNVGFIIHQSVIKLRESMIQRI
jgi:RNA polymerase sigma factor (sigma-70 family)